MQTDCIMKLTKLQISELNTLVQKKTSSDVEGKPPPSDKRRGEEIFPGPRQYIEPQAMKNTRAEVERK
jgi:hypothetical protein